MNQKKLLSTSLILASLILNCISTAFAEGTYEDVSRFKEYDIEDMPEFIREFIFNPYLYYFEPYANEILYLWDKGIVEGYSDGTFKSTNTINRAEFLKIAMEASDYELVGSNCFPDVKNDWYAKYVCSAKKQGLVQGYPDGNFYPAKEITLAEAAKIVSEALKIPVDESYNETWHHKYIKALEQYDAVPVTAETFGKQITRGEMAAIVARVMANKSIYLSATYESIKMLEENRAKFNDITNPDSVLFSAYVSSLNLNLDPAEVLEIIPEQTSKEIRYLVSKNIRSLLGDGSIYQMFLFEHKGIPYMVYPIALRHIVMPTLDAETLVFADTGNKITTHKAVNLLKDKRTVYQVNDKPESLSIITYEDIDASTFTILNEDAREICLTNTLCIYKDKNNLYYTDNIGLVVKEEADPLTFELFYEEDERLIEFMNLRLFKDKNYVYFYNVITDSIDIIRDADPLTFVMFADDSRSFSHYFKDANHVFVYDYNDMDENEYASFTLIPGVNPQTFNISTYEQN